MQTSIEKSVQWLFRAQDVGDDEGFASHYHVKKGWFSSYPEVTGYIIPTLLHYTEKNKKHDLTDRVLRAADWLVSIQMDNGGFQGRLLADKPVTPVIFNTGMILFGLVDAYLNSHNEKYRKSAIAAADWLLECQDNDGVWRKHLTLNGTGETHIYHTRVSWGLLKIFDITQDERYIKAASKHIDWALTLQIDNGWFNNSDLYEKNSHQPLIHFLVYTIRGILECGLHQNNSRYIEAATLSAEKFLETQLLHNAVYARYDRNWKPVVNWKCLTGIAQITIVYLRLFHHTDDKKWIVAAQHNLNYLYKVQTKGDERVDGALAGSEPIDGEYMPMCYLSWATKFHLEAMILYDELTI